MNESNPIGVRVPKGILKNSGRSSTSYSSGLSETNQEYGNPGAGYMSQDHYGHHHAIPPPQLQQQQQQHQQHALQGYHSAPLQVYSHEYGSMPTGQIPYSVPGSQDYSGGVGSTMSSQWDEYYSGMSTQHVQAPIDYVPTFRRKLERFITKKHNLLFQQLTAEEKPLLESRLVEKKSEGSYGVTPSLDEYLPLDSNEQVKEFFRTVQTGDIVVGEVYSKSSSGLTFRLLCFDGGKRAYLEDLSIKGVCPPSQTIPLDSSDKAYEEDDKARLEILEINFDSRKLILGMKGMKLSNEIRHAFPLGPVANEDLPREFIMTKIEAKSRRKRSYEQVLEDSSGFHNPNSTMCLGTSLGIFSNKKSLMLGLSGSYLKKDLASELRSSQNAKWAQHNVALGIRHFKQGNQVEAFQCLNKAMIIDPQNVEGLVARGALYANNGSFEKALEDFDAALKNAPDHFNGRKYMAETLIVFGKNKQEEGKLEEAFNSYSKCLATLPEHKEAILSLMSVHEQVDKVDTTRLSSTVVNKIVEVREKLRNMIAEEIAKKKLSYYDKIQGSASALGKKEKESSDSDSSSSDSSDSDSGSTSDGGRRDKKKKGKKRKKRSKKSKRSSKNSKSESLSPFSRKLAGSEMVGSAVSASSFTDWTQQIGINKMAGGSDVESQRSSKKSKRDKRSKKKKEKKKKKKRGSSSSSDSDTRDKSKKEKSKVITDFGEIEEQLTAFFSKCEQGKSDSRGGVHIPPQAVKVTVKQNVDRDYDRYNSSSRHIELVQDDLGRKASTRFSYNTDEGKSFLQSQNIVRTVQNDQTLRQVSTSSPDSSANDLDQSTKTPASKWRTIGSSDTAYSISTLGPVIAPKTIEKAVPPAPPARELPFAVSLDKLKPKDNDVRPERNYRSHSRQRSGSRDRRRSRSLSRSRSRSRSPFMHNRPRRNHSPGPRRRSFSRSRSRSGSRPSRRSRSGSPRRFRGGGRGRGRGFHGGRGGTRGNGKPFPPVVRISRFRNRFSRSKSRSDSKDRKASSRSPVRNKDAGGRSSSRHHSPNLQSKKKETGKRSARLSDEDVRSKGSIPISSRKTVERKEKLHVLGLDTNKASDVEKLLAKHKAQKKEELREMNPDFFRLP